MNGAGKSTLIKLLAETEPLTHGEYKLGHTVQPDYFAQDQYKELDPEARILDDLGEASPRSTQTELRSLLGCFLFQADDVFKRIGVLSGGERGRYALLRLLRSLQAIRPGSTRDFFNLAAVHIRRELLDLDTDSVYIFPMCQSDFDRVRIVGQGFDRKLVADEVLTTVI